MRGWAFPFDKSRCQLSIELLDEGHFHTVSLFGTYFGRNYKRHILDAYFDLTSTIVSMRDAQNIQLLIGRSVSLDSKNENAWRSSCNF